MNTLGSVISIIGRSIDVIGVAVIVIGLISAVGRYIAQGRLQADGYRTFRQDMGRGILIGLEFLIAADIVRTVAITPTMTDVVVLGLIVLIRTFLSLSLQVEIEGRWPWQTKKTDVSPL